jgi:predicted PurR-regulated permease PerM
VRSDRHQRPFSAGGFYTIYFVRSLLLPLVLALLLSYLLRPIVRGLAKLKIPPLIGGALLLISLFGALGYAFPSRRSGRQLD